MLNASFEVEAGRKVVADWQWTNQISSGKE